MSDRIKEALQDTSLTKSEVLLSVLFLIDKTSVTLPEIREKAVEIGLTKLKKWNLSDVLGKTSPLVVKGKNGWEITPSGKAKAVGILKINQKSQKIVSDLRAHIEKIANVHTKGFLIEAVECLENKYFRAAVVLSWAGAISTLHHHVIANHLASFNAAAVQRNAKWKAAKTTDDLGLMKEDEFLDVLQAISMIGKNVKQELKDQCLKLRNGYAHPNSLVVAENRVVVHLETLILNVFEKFPL